MKWGSMWVAILAFASAMAQVSAPKFESATIAESDGGEGRSGYFTVPGKVTLENQTLKDCVRIAYDMEVARAAAAPKWIETQRFNIEARSARVLEDREAKAMLRALLSDQFGLTLHRESRISPAFALLVAKSGVKIRKVEPGPGRIRTRSGSMTAECASMANLAQSLSVALNTPVIDMTALSGVFNFTLEWRPQVVQPGELTDDDDKEPNVLPNPPPSPTLFRAVEEQLGLKLERRKVPLEVLVIDHAARPKN